MIALLIITVIGSGGPAPHPGTPYQPIPLTNATVFVQPVTHSHPVFKRKTDKHGRAMFHFAPGRYRVKAVLESSSPALRCQERTVTVTGKTRKVRLICQIR